MAVVHVAREPCSLTRSVHACCCHLDTKAFPRQLDSQLCCDGPAMEALLRSPIPSKNDSSGSLSALVGASCLTRTVVVDTDTCYNQRAEQYKVLPGMCECAATAEAAEQPPRQPSRGLAGSRVGRSSLSRRVVNDDD